MENSAKQYHCDQVIQTYGTIRGQQDDAFIVATGRDVWMARPAASCLLRPLVGDKVLVTAHPDHAAYILAVLERDPEATAELAFEGNVAVTARKGAISLAAAEGLDLVTNAAAEIVSDGLKITSTQADINISRLSLWGELCETNVRTVRMVASALESVVERFRQRLGRSFRTIEESEQVRADRFECNAKTLVSLKGKYSCLTATEDVKVDGERIHIG